MKYCSECGAEVEYRIPEADNRHRHVCPACRTVHYSNPRIVAGCIPDFNGRVLLCRRAIEPRYGLWTLPAGFMETGESTVQAAERETLEEANARVEVQDLYMIINLLHVDQVYMMYRAHLPEAAFSPGAESLETALYAPDEVPWDRIAFPAVSETLKYYFRDRAAGAFPIRTGAISRDAGGYSFRLLQPRADQSSGIHLPKLHS